MADEGDAGETLEGGWQTTVRRVGNTVRRSPSLWSPTVVAFLAHLQQAGFSAAPCPVGDGFDEAGNECLEFVEGESPQPRPWSDDAVHRVGTLLAELHQASRSFVAPRGALWQDWYGRGKGEPTVIGHGDLGPWNILAVDTNPVAFIDWDTAGPTAHVWEVAQAAWLNAQLHDDDVAERAGLGDAAARATQLRAFVDGYQLPAIERRGLVDKMVEFAVDAAADQAVAGDVTPEMAAAVDEGGFPLAWAMAWRVRSASWMLRNRSLLEAALR